MNKLEDLGHTAFLDDYDVILLTETWLKCDIMDSELALNDDYFVFRCDRSYDTSNCTRGGGVLIATKKNLVVKRLSINRTNLELVVIIVKIDKISVIFGCIYVPPQANLSIYESVCDSLDFVFTNNECDLFVLVGDFNLPNVTWLNEELAVRAVGCMSPQIECMADCFAYLNLFQLNYIPNVTGNFLDLVLSNDRSIVVNMVSEPFLRCDKYHPAINFTLCLPEQHVPLSFDYEYYNFKIIHYPDIVLYLVSFPWDDILNVDDVNIALDRFYEILFSAFDMYVPKGRSRNRKFPKSFGPELRGLIIEKKKAHKAFKASGLPEDYLRFSALRDECKGLSILNKQQYITCIEDSILSDNSRFWNYIREKNNSNNFPNTMSYNGVTSSSVAELSQMFANFLGSVYVLDDNIHNIHNFQPHCEASTDLGSLSIGLIDVFNCLDDLKASLGAGPDGVPRDFLYNCKFVLSPILQKIFNISLATGVFPEVWKTSYITPIFKNGDRADVSNYRGISKSSLFSKVFERIVSNYMTPKFRSILCDEQHGFRVGRSTVTNLLVYEEFVSDALEGRYGVHAIYTDFSKAFDTVNHGMLISKLSALGLHGSFLDWISSFLLDRKQIVNINGVLSSPLSVTSGVPQGSHLSTLLFNCFINDIKGNILNSKFLLYADDFKLFRQIENLHDCELLQQDLNRFTNWCKNNLISLNINKCSFMNFSRLKIPLTYEYKADNHILPQVKIVKDLGVTFDGALRFNDHIDFICNKAFRLLGFICRSLKDFSNINCFKTLYCSLIRSVLEYASVVWTPYYDKHIDRIERIQKKFLRIIAHKMNIPYDEINYSDLQQLLNLSPLKNRRIYLDVCFLHKLCNNSTDCSILLQSIGLLVPQRNTRKHETFAVKFHRTLYGQQSALTRLCSEFNRLPDVDIFHSSYRHFKHKSHLILS